MGGTINDLHIPLHALDYLGVGIFAITGALAAARKRHDVITFVVFSIIARGGRFFIVAIVLNRYGAWIREVIEKRLGLWVALAAGTLVIGFIIAFRLF